MAKSTNWRQGLAAVLLVVALATGCGASGQTSTNVGDGPGVGVADLVEAGNDPASEPAGTAVSTTDCRPGTVQRPC